MSNVIHTWFAGTLAIGRACCRVVCGMCGGGGVCGVCGGAVVVVVVVRCGVVRRRGVAYVGLR